MKHCNKCNQDKPLDEFYNNKSKRDGRSPYCMPCWRTYIKDSHRTPEKMRNMLLKRRYKITLEQYYEKLEEQGGGCALCGALEHGRKYKGNISFSVDHDHKCCDTEYTCGKCVRGLLCNTCNTKIGAFENLFRDTEWLMKAKEYVIYWNKEAGIRELEKESEI